MSYLKQFLTDLTDSGEYYAEMLDNCAEIYIVTEQKPVLMLEFDEKVYHLNFRCDLTSNTVAQMTYDMACIDEDLVIGKDFFSSPDTGIVYGKEALDLYFTSIVQAIDTARLQQETTLDDSVYVVTQPIMTYGKKNDTNNKLQRLWGTDLE